MVSKIPSAGGMSPGHGRKKTLNRYGEQMILSTQSNFSTENIDAAKDAKDTADDAVLLKRYEILQLVGTGNYARVYRGISNQGRIVAIKAINLSRTTDHYKRKFLPRELTILRKIKHVNICRTYEIFQASDRIFIIMHFCLRGTIADLLHRMGPIGENTVRFLVTQINDAINYLHSINIAHRDLKVENILLDNDYTPKLTDFSYGICIKEKTSNPKQSNKINSPSHSTSRTRLDDTFCGTLPYLSPEMIRKLPYDSRRNDIWSFGVCIYIMLNDRLPFAFENIRLMIKKQLTKDYKFRSSIILSEQIKNLVNLMLEPDPKRRPSCAEIAKHPWFSSGPVERPVET